MSGAECEEDVCGPVDSDLKPGDIQQLLVSKEEVPTEQQEWSPSLDQEDPPELPHIKEEEEEHWISQEGEQHRGLEEADIIKFTFTPVPVKSEEDDEEKPQSSIYGQLLSVSKEEVPPEQQEWSPSLDQEDPQELPHIKEEEEELWISQEREQLEGLQEADIIKFTFTPVPVKSEEDDEEETPQSSQLHQNQTEENRDEYFKTEADGEDCGETEPDQYFSPERHLQPDTDDETSHSEPDTDDSCDWQDVREPEFGLIDLQDNEEHERDVECNTGRTPVSSSECATNCGHEGHLHKHNGVQTGVKPFRCSVCGKRYSWKKSLTDHMKLHSEELFSCSVCKKTFKWRRNIVRHMRIHTGEKPFSCSICGLRFTQSSAVTKHLRVHTGEKPFSCSVCKASFKDRHNLLKHTKLHTGEKPFSCSVCGKRFAQKTHLRRHLNVHTGEKPFSCSVCGKDFTQKTHLRQHLTVHTGEKPFSCSVCGKRFAQRGTMKEHLSVHTGEKPFSCNVCSKRFTKLSYIKKHKCVGESSINK
ncbi:zinc finger protein 287-like [Dicentrarchus labrax]|uniref:zinc finger protein 287-like n=1 Tax=Dicentrarchus labrax TaxID=13489 RepID=UPI0021F51858|nr:zinc finger protein 287-like [Dicentrarchus labrax]